MDIHCLAPQKGRWRRDEQHPTGSYPVHHRVYLLVAKPEDDVTLLQVRTTMVNNGYIVGRTKVSPFPP